MYRSLKGKFNENYTHGKSHTTIYRTWSATRSRCTNPNHNQYHKYGAVGIKLCEEWNKFENFLLDMGEQPNGKRLQRKDELGMFCKDNCYWG